METRVLGKTIHNFLQTIDNNNWFNWFCFYKSSFPSVVKVIFASSPLLWKIWPSGMKLGLYPERFFSLLLRVVVDSKHTCRMVGGGRYTLNTHYREIGTTDCTCWVLCWFDNFKFFVWPLKSPTVPRLFTSDTNYSFCALLKLHQKWDVDTEFFADRCMVIFVGGLSSIGL